MIERNWVCKIPPASLIGTKLIIDKATNQVHVFLPKIGFVGRFDKRLYDRSKEDRNSAVMAVLKRFVKRR